MIYVIPNPGQPNGEHNPQGTVGRTEWGQFYPQCLLYLAKKKTKTGTAAGVYSNV